MTIMIITTEVDSKIARSKRSCDVCGKSFNHYSRLRRHLLVHSTEKPHRCDQCGKRFKRKDALKSHKQGAENAGKCLKPAIMQQKKTILRKPCVKGWLLLDGASKRSNSYSQETYSNEKQ